MGRKRELTQQNERNSVGTEAGADCAFYLQVGLHERSSGLHQVVTDTPLTRGGSFVERRLTSERNSNVSHSTRQDSEEKVDWTHVSLSVMSR